jgi:predicted transcriptional regulator
MNTMCIFVCMSEKKNDKNVISVRPPNGSPIKERLQTLADKTDRSMNYWAVKAVEELLKKHKVK